MHLNYFTVVILLLIAVCAMAASPTQKPIMKPTFKPSLKVAATQVRYLYNIRRIPFNHLFFVRISRYNAISAFSFLRRNQLRLHQWRQGNQRPNLLLASLLTSLRMLLHRSLLQNQLINQQVVLHHDPQVDPQRKSFIEIFMIIHSSLISLMFFHFFCSLMKYVQSSNIKAYSTSHRASIDATNFATINAAQ